MENAKTFGLLPLAEDDQVSLGFHAREAYIKVH